MNAEQNTLEQIVKVALEEFNSNEDYLIEKDVSERCIVSKFAMYLDMEIKRLRSVEKKYDNYHVDVEYNRGFNGNDYAPKTNPNNNKKIVTDLVVHRRGYNKDVHQHGDRINIGYDNLICMEFKKSADPELISSDLERLKMMTKTNEGFFYSIGFMIVINRSTKKLEINKVFFDDYV